jgi:hypothetical protein
LSIFASVASFAGGQKIVKRFWSAFTNWDEMIPVTKFLRDTISAFSVKRFEVCRKHIAWNVDAMILTFSGSSTPFLRYMLLRVGAFPVP